MLCALLLLRQAAEGSACSGVFLAADGRSGRLSHKTQPCNAVYPRQQAEVTHGLRTLTPCRRCSRCSMRAGSWLITGGTGALGTLMATWLASEAPAASITLCSRSGRAQQQGPKAAQLARLLSGPSCISICRCERDRGSTWFVLLATYADEKSAGRCDSLLFSSNHERKSLRSWSLNFKGSVC